MPTCPAQCFISFKWDWNVLALGLAAWREEREPKVDKDIRRERSETMALDFIIEASLC
jgi:hypothetical protein